MRSVRLLLCLLCFATSLVWVPAARAQEGEFTLQAAIREGACDDRGDRIAALEDPELPNGDEEGSRDGLSALVSESTVDVPIEDLIEDDSIIAITREGESGVDACGAIGGLLTRRDVLTIQISEAGDSGVWGVAVLFPNDDDDETTDVQLYLGGPGLEGAPEPAEEPAEEPSEDPSEEPSTGGGDFETISSPSFGFSLEYDPEVWTIADEQTTSAEGIESFSIEAGFTRVYFDALPATADAQRCVEVFADSELNADNVLDVAPLEDENGDPIEGGDGSDAFVGYQLQRTASDGSEISQAFYVRCIVLAPGEAVLAIRQYSAAELYPLAAILLETLLLGLDLP